MLPFLKETQEVNNENYWSILIEDEWVASAIWQIKDNKVEIISSFSQNDSENNLIDTVDATLSSCIQNLPESFHDPSKTVFGVLPLWLENGELKKEYLEKLKRMCDQLSLTPVGFVVLPEAISNYLKSKEEIPLTAITLGIYDQNLDFSVFNDGKLSISTSVARSTSVVDDFFEGLGRLIEKLEIIPSRIVLYNHKLGLLEDIKNSLDNIDWSEHKMGNFLHVPKFEILNPDEKILAISFAGGSEISGTEKVYFKGLAKEADEIEADNTTDIENVQKPSDVTAESLGFVVEKPSVIPPKISGIKLRFPRISLPNMPKMRFSFSGKPILYFVIGLFLISSIIFVSWWILPKASVTIVVAPKKLEDRLDLKLGRDLIGEEIKTSVSGEKTTQTTGIKIVGEKAKGQIKIRNGTSLPITLSAGSVIVSAGDLKFVLLEQASVSGAITPSDPGMTNVDVEAGNIGSEYNLARDEIFKVSNYPKSEVDAISLNDFSGGSSREIKVVSEDDRKRLLKELTSEIIEKAKDKLKEMVSSDKIIADSLSNVKTIEENFSNKNGDEASVLKLSLKLDYQAIVLSLAELNKITTDILKERFPPGYVLKDDQISYKFIESDTDDSFSVMVTANLLPDIDTYLIAKKIAGKYPGVAEEYLRNIPGFVEVRFRLPTLLKGRFGTLPHIVKRISINLASEK